jgi:hypothetical protein
MPSAAVRRAARVGCIEARMSSRCVVVLSLVELTPYAGNEMGVQSQRATSIKKNS